MHQGKVLIELSEMRKIYMLFKQVECNTENDHSFQSLISRTQSFLFETTNHSLMDKTKSNLVPCPINLVIKIIFERLVNIT